MRKPVVLFVDDEEHVLRSIERIIIREPYTSLFAIGPAKALEILAMQPVDVIVSDMKMPEMDGLSFLCRIKELYPQIVRLVLSGFSQVSQVVATVNRGEIFRFLTKPLDDPDEFRTVIRTSIKQATLEQWAANLNEWTDSLSGQFAACISAVSGIAEELRTKYANETERRRIIDGLNRECAEMRSLLQAFREKKIPDSAIPLARTAEQP